MTKVHTEIFCGKTIDVFKGCNDYYRDAYFVEIDGKPFKAQSDNSNTKYGKVGYRSIGLAAGSAKHSITLHMNKDEEIKRIEEQIAELQAKLEELKNS